MVFVGVPPSTIRARWAAMAWCSDRECRSLNAAKYVSIQLLSLIFKVVAGLVSGFWCCCGVSP